MTAGEDCDGADPVGLTCADLGFNVGEVRCSSHCRYDGATCAHTFRSVAAGHQHTCAVKTDGTTACWGVDDNGQATPPAGAFSQVGAGNAHTCGVRTDGTVACWGSNTYVAALVNLRWLNAVVFVLVCLLAACGGRSNCDDRPDSAEDVPGIALAALESRYRGLWCPTIQSGCNPDSGVVHQDSESHEKQQESACSNGFR